MLISKRSEWCQVVQWMNHDESENCFESARNEGSFNILRAGRACGSHGCDLQLQFCVWYRHASFFGRLHGIPTKRAWNAGDDMVFQGDVTKLDAVYGYGAAPGATVSVTVTAASNEHDSPRSSIGGTGIANSDGVWRVDFTPPARSTTEYTLTASTSAADDGVPTQMSLQRVLFGDVRRVRSPMMFDFGILT